MERGAVLDHAEGCVIYDEDSWILHLDAWKIRGDLIWDVVPRIHWGATTTLVHTRPWRFFRIFKGSSVSRRNMRSTTVEGDSADSLRRNNCNAPSTTTTRRILKRGGYCPKRKFGLGIWTSEEEVIEPILFTRHSLRGYTPAEVKVSSNKWTGFF